MNREVRYLTDDSLLLRTSTEDGITGPILDGYAATFGKPFDIGDDVFGWSEIVDAKAFDRALSEQQDVRLLVNHDGLPLARTASGTLTLSTDRRGLAIRSTLDATDPDVQAIMPKMKRGDLNQMSIAFSVRTEEWTAPTRTKRATRTILDADLYDVSLVTYPANPATSAQLRSVVPAEVVEAFRRVTVPPRGGNVRQLRRRLDLAAIS